MEILTWKRYDALKARAEKAEARAEKAEAALARIQKPSEPLPHIHKQLEAMGGMTPCEECKEREARVAGLERDNSLLHSDKVRAFEDLVVAEGRIRELESHTRTRIASKPGEHLVPELALRNAEKRIRELESRGED